MKQKYPGVLTALLLIFHCMPAFMQESITVKAGTKIIDYFPPAERYRYPGFVSGKAVFRDGTFTTAQFNYNILYGEMQFIQSHDTLEIANAESLRLVILAADTFYFDKGYLEVRYSNGSDKLAVKEYVKLIDTKKMGAYGMTSSTSAISSYNSISATSGYYKLTVSDDLVVKKVKEFYLYTPGSGFQLFRKNNAMQAFPNKKDAIKQYLKINDVDFNSEADLLKLMEYLAAK